MGMRREEGKEWTDSKKRICAMGWKPQLSVERTKKRECCARGAQQNDDPLRRYETGMIDQTSGTAVNLLIILSLVAVQCAAFVLLTFRALQRASLNG